DEAEPIFKYVQRLFPRYDAATNLYTDLVTDEGINVATFDPGYALVFWLVGFSGDPADPFRDHRLRMGLGGAAPELE
ncbi:MAG: hypothetical protein GTO53_04670, partial [Planctomycetales bacterium]|nr:hypothetical protein [Planctomycetales bacterium]NIM08449.1 hypothetical protein [Planctomycetales bacterium]NIN07925.1 hypothetical protein [Planctomycetales bacterium]NIN77055.1 hypothetical protein [Planctomycetales bacterium]NIO34240.1 hypothetical protein [Planctomycetales bacterium]